jgi:hypothetical protein
MTIDKRQLAKHQPQTVARPAAGSGKAEARARSTGQRDLRVAVLGS